MRLIDADALLAYVNEWSRKLHAGVYHNDAIIMDVLTSVYEHVANSPTIDAVKVVRCKDCGRSEPDCLGEGYVYCNHTGMVVLNNDYCSHGERKMDLEDK